MDALLAGYRRFRTGLSPDRRALFEQLAATGQRPKALVLGCVDSRVDPAMIFDAAPGELLVMRNVANLAPPYAPRAAGHATAAALEFGVRVLEVPHIVVLGHSMCGGVRALLEGAPEAAREFVAPWLALAAPAHDRVRGLTDPGERQRCCEQEVVRLSLANLMTYPWIAERVADGRLALHGAWFAIHSGVLTALGPDGGFTPVG